MQILSKTTHLPNIFVTHPTLCDLLSLDDQTGKHTYIIIYFSIVHYTSVFIAQLNLNKHLSPTKVEGAADKRNHDGRIIRWTAISAHHSRVTLKVLL